MHRALIEFLKEVPDSPLEALLSHAPLWMIALDEESRITHASRFWTDILGYRDPDLVGRDYRDLLTVAGRKTVDQEIEPQLEASGRVHGIEVAFLTADGRPIPVMLSGTVVPAEDAKPERTLLILMDNAPSIDARHRNDEFLRLAEDSSRSKSRFLAAMSHEIRTPLNAIMGFAQLLELSNLDAKRAAHVKAILTAGGALTNLLTDLLDLSQVEEGKMRIEARAFDLIDLLDQVAEWWLSSATQKGLRMQVDLDRSLPRHVFADPTRLQQVLNNFLGNAVKFTRKGSVTLRVLRVPDPGPTVRLRFEVEDTGPGMSTVQVSKLFRPFVQIESDFGNESGGWGLGLSICANIATRLGADIGVDTAPGAGATFYFETDVEIARAPEFPAAKPEDTPRNAVDSGLRILVAEDNKPNQQLMCILLEELGHTPIPVDNGFEAVAHTFREPVDLILMDVMMPGLDGLGAFKQIRSADNPMRGVPIVACSAHVAEEARRRYLAIGMDAFLPKPVDRDELCRVIDSLAPRRGKAVLAK